jgi:hypothetical protein
MSDQHLPIHLGIKMNNSALKNECRSKTMAYPCVHLLCLPTVGIALWNVANQLA